MDFKQDPRLNFLWLKSLENGDAFVEVMNKLFRKFIFFFGLLVSFLLIIQYRISLFLVD